MSRKLRPVAVPMQPMVQGGRFVAPLTSSPERQRWPHRLVFWDCEAEQTEAGGFEFLCAHAQLYTRQRDSYTYQAGEQLLADSPAELWDAIHSWTRHKETMRLYAKNMVFDLGVSCWAEHLWERLGYRGTPGQDMHWSASSVTPWLGLHLGDRAKLTFVDTTSLFHCSSDRLGRDLGRPPQPPLDDPEARCRWDTETLAAAVLAYLERLRQLGVSPAAPSGTGHGFAVLRTRFLEPRQVVHHTDEELWQVECQSRNGGNRREGWRHGAISEPLQEWDYQNAHLHICLEPLPSRVRDPLYAAALPGADETTLQEWLVATDVPCVPYQKPDGSVIYPVGRFPALLWGPEAALALDNGATLAPAGRLWRYQLAPVMRPFAEWCLDELAAQDDPLWARVLKSWSHQVVGKWGQANSTYQAVDEPWPQEWQGPPFAEAWQVDHPDGYSRVLHTDVGAWGIRDEAEPASYANVALQSYVMALVRVRLWRAMQAAGLDEVVYVNGDGLVVTRRGGKALERAGLPGLRPKYDYPQGLEVWNAQAVLDRSAEQHHKVAGLPRGSERIGPTTWATETWHQGLLDAPVVRRGVWRLPVGPLGRVRAADGRTMPYRAARW